MSLLPGERKGGRDAPIHIGVTNTVVHYHYYINQCHSHSIRINIDMQKIDMQKKLSPKTGTGNNYSVNW